MLPKIMSQYALNFTFSAWILIHFFIIFKDFEFFSNSQAHKFSENTI